MQVRLGKEDLAVVLRDTGFVLEYASVAILIPIIVSLIYGEPLTVIAVYLLVAALTFLVGHVLRRGFAATKETELKHAFLSVSVLWLVYPAFAALPFVLIHGMGFVDALFESMSAITTTGLSMMFGTIDSAPASLIFWRSLISWIGGVGIVVMALVGVLTTYTRSAKFMIAEGRETRIKPNLKNTIREIWSIYLLLTILGVVMLYFSGMDLFSAVNYSMSAISTTGMETTSTGLMGLNNYWIDLSLIILMVLGATSFSIHYLFIKKKNFWAYFQDPEFKVLIIFSLLSTLLIAPKLINLNQSAALGTELAAFYSFSAMTCGGFTLTSFTNIFNWPDFVKIILIGLMFIGGSAGSTAGGIKISRFIIAAKSVLWKVKALLLPRDSFFQKKFDGKVVKDEEVREINQFILLYALFIIIGVVVLSFQGADLGNALFEVASAQSNVGISTGLTQAGMPIASEIILILNMWIGRLEIIPILAGIGFLLSYRAR